MNDLVARLRETDPEKRLFGVPVSKAESADEIERVEAENRRLYEMIDKARGSLGYKDVPQITEWFNYFFPPVLSLSAAPNTEGGK